MTTGLHKNHWQSHHDLTERQVGSFVSETGRADDEGAAVMGSVSVSQPTEIGRTGQSRAERVGIRGGRGKRSTVAEKLEARITREPSGGCWNVSGADRGPGGYRHINPGDPANPKKLVYAHRVAWELANGPIPAGLKVLHRCDNPRCANPEHLFLGTQGDNIRDCSQKQRRNAFGRQKLQEPDVLAIRARAGRGETHASIGRSFGVKRHTVSGIVSGQTWRHLLAPYVPVQPLVNVEPVRFVLLPVKGVLHLEQPIAQSVHDHGQVPNQFSHADGAFHVR